MEAVVEALSLEASPPVVPSDIDFMPRAHTVLLIGEHRFDQVQCKSVLISAGFRVESATSTIDGVELAHRIKPDIILLNVARNGLTRLVTLTALRMSRDVAHIPVMLVVAANDLTALDEGYELGAADFITKPIEFPYLLARLNFVLSSPAGARNLRPMTSIAQHVNRAASTQLAKASHKMRDALTPIAGFSSLMLSEVFGPLSDPRYGEMATGLASASQDFLALVENLDDIAMIASGRLKINDDVVSLPDIVGAVTQRLQPVAKAKSLELRDSVRGTGIRLRGDSARLQRIVRNLLSNAIKSTPAGGLIRIYVNAGYPNGLRVVVEDTGIGMTVSRVQRLNTAMRSAGSTLKRLEGEVGYGLAIAQALTAMHGGDLDFDSAPGGGMRAALVLPSERLLEAA